MVHTNPHTFTIKQTFNDIKREKINETNFYWLYWRIAQKEWIIIRVRKTGFIWVFVCFFLHQNWSIAHCNKRDRVEWLSSKFMHTCSLAQQASVAITYASWLCILSVFFVYTVVQRFELTTVSMNDTSNQNWYIFTNREFFSMNFL